MKQNTQEWLEMRKKYVGASDAPAIMKVSPWKTPFQLWEEKVGLSAPQKQTYAMSYGHEMEEPARRAYEKHTNNLVAPEVIFHPKHKFMMASLDGLSLNGDVIVEIKNANEEDHSMARNGTIPEKYWPQVQHQLDCLPGALLHYWSFRNGEGVLVEVERDEKYIRDLVAEEGQFWEKVMGFEAPELLETDFIEFIEDPEWIRLANERRHIDKLQKELKVQDKRNRDEMLRKADGRSVKGNGVKFTRFMEKGRVDYSAIPELESINLDLFRKGPTEKWRLSLYNCE